MSIREFIGNTFVAFIDISGFKELMKDGENAWNALDIFYQAGYDSIRNNNGRVEGLLVSDCGILFARNNDNNILQMLESLLNVVKIINNKMLESDYMLTTSIAYGEFKYQERIEFPGIGKHPIYGNAYVQAFLDNASGLPKIEPGFCRILRKNLPQEIIVGSPQLNNSPFNMLSERKGDKNCIYFYWNLNAPRDIEKFESEYKNSYSLKFSGMLKALKHPLNAV